MSKPEYIFLRRIMGSLNNGRGINNGGGGRWGDDWWDAVDALEEWQKGVYYFLCSCYALVSFVALVPLIRIQLRVPEFGWTTQKIFHLMNFIVIGLRVALFGMYKCGFAIRSKAFEMLLLDLPGLLFFSTYMLLVLFWAEIYQQARSQPICKLRPAYHAINGIIYFAQFCSRNFTALLLSCLFICGAQFFNIPGRLFVMLRHFPIVPRGRQKKLYVVGFVTVTCCAYFFIRCLVDSIAAFNEKADVDVLEHPIFNLFCYMLVEIVPSSLVLFVLRKLPPRHVSDQYHPIR